MGYSTPSACFIIDIEGGGMCKFQFMPDEIVDSDSANYAEYPIAGRSAPLRGYIGGPPRTLEFTLKFFANPTADGAPKSPGEIKLDIDFLKSLTRPDYAGGLKPPHKCLIIIGAQVQMIGTCDNVSVSIGHGVPWDLGPGLAHGASVSLRFAEAKDIPLDVYDVRGGSF